METAVSTHKQTATTVELVAQNVPAFKVVSLENVPVLPVKRYATVPVLTLQATRPTVVGVARRVSQVKAVPTAHAPVPRDKKCVAAHVPR